MSRHRRPSPLAIGFVLLLIGGILAPWMAPGASAFGERPYDGNQVISGTSHFDVYQGQSVAQSFVPTAKYVIVSVTLRLRNTGDLTDALNVTLRSDADGVPAGAYTAAGEIVVGDTVLSQRNIPFTSTPVLTPGTRYWIVAQSASSSSNTYEWHHSNADAYGSGKAMTTGGLLSGWSEDPLFPTDMYFLTHGQEVEANVSADIVPTTADIRPGDLVTFRITLSNTGSNSAGTVWLNDTLLPGFTFVSDNATDAGASTGHPSYTFSNVANGARSFDLIVQVDSGTEPGTVLSKVLTLRYTDSTGAVRSGSDASAIVVVGIVIKSVYLHPDPVGASPRRLIAARPVGGEASQILLRRDDTPHDFDLEPVLSRPFRSVAQASATLYIDSEDHSMRALDVNLTLSDWNGVSQVPIAYVERRITTNSGDDFQSFTFGFPALDYTFPAGSRIRLTIVNRGTGERDLLLAMNSSTLASALAFRTTTYVRIDSLELRDATAVVSVWSPKDALVVRANVSDPFGTPEIAGARVTIMAPSGSVVVNDAPMAVLATDPSSPSAWQAFQLSIGPALANGTYSILVRATESDGARDIAEATAIVRAPRFSLQKTANETAVQPGDRFRYDLWFNNTGTGVAGQIWINDSLPSGVTFVSTSDQAAMTGNYTWAWSFLGPGSYLLQIEVEAVGGTAFFRNRASLNYTDEKGFAWPMEEAEKDVSFDGPSIDLNMSSADATIHSNETIEYDFALHNTGEAASTLWLNDTLPTNVSYLSDTASDIGGIRTQSGTKVNFSFSDMPASTIWSFTLTVRANSSLNPGSELANQATLAYANVNGILMPPREATWTLTVVAPHVPSAIVSIAPTVAAAGETVGVAVEFSNVGTEPARDVWINLTLDPNLEFVNGSIEPNPSEPPVRFHMTDLPLGPSSVFLNVRVRPTVPDLYSIRVNGTLAYADGFRNMLPSVEIAPDSFEASAPQFALTAAPDNMTVEAGRTGAITINQANTGSGVAGDVRLSLSLPAGFVHVSDTADVEPISSGSGLTWQWSNLAPEASKEFTIAVQAAVSTPDGTPANLTFNLTYSDVYGNPRANLPLVVRATIVAPRLEMSLERTDDAVLAGDAVTFTLTVRNLGSTAMRNLWLTSVLDARFELLAHRSSVLPSIQLSEFTWSFTDLGSGQETNVSLVVRIRAGTPANELVELFFTARYTNSVGDPIPGSQQVGTSVRIEDTTVFYVTLFGAALGVAAVLIVFLRRNRIQIEEVFLVNSDGVLLYHIARSLTSDKDEDVVSGMLTAVQDFVKETFQYGERRGLSHLDFGDYRILIERGDHVYLAVVYSGHGAQFLRRKVRKVLWTIEIAYGKVLELWDGDMEKVLGAKDIIREYLLNTSGRRTTKAEPKPT